MGVSMAERKRDWGRTVGIAGGIVGILGFIYTMAHDNYREGNIADGLVMYAYDNDPGLMAAMLAGASRPKDLGALTVFVAFTNESSETVKGLRVIAGLKDADGNVEFVESDGDAVAGQDRFSVQLPIK